MNLGNEESNRKSNGRRAGRPPKYARRIKLEPRGEGAALRTILSILGRTVEEGASLIRASPSTFSKILNGVSSVPPDVRLTDTIQSAEIPAALGSVRVHVEEHPALWWDMARQHAVTRGELGADVPSLMMLIGHGPLAESMTPVLPRTMVVIDRFVLLFDVPLELRQRCIHAAWQLPVQRNNPKHLRYGFNFVVPKVGYLSLAPSNDGSFGRLHLNRDFVEGTFVHEALANFLQSFSDRSSWAIGSLELANDIEVRSALMLHHKLRGQTCRVRTPQSDWFRAEAINQYHSARPLELIAYDKFIEILDKARLGRKRYPRLRRMHLEEGRLLVACSEEFSRVLPRHLRGWAYAHRVEATVSLLPRQDRRPEGLFERLRNPFDRYLSCYMGFDRDPLWAGLHVIARAIGTVALLERLEQFGGSDAYQDRLLWLADRTATVVPRSRDRFEDAREPLQNDLDRSLARLWRS